MKSREIQDSTPHHQHPKDHPDPLHPLPPALTQPPLPALDPLVVLPWHVRVEFQGQCQKFEMESRTRESWTTWKAGSMERRPMMKKIREKRQRLMRTW